MFTLPELLYDYGALEPHIDARTMEIHHTKHHKGYVDKLNGALESASDFASRDLGDLLAHLDEVPENIRTAVRNNGGGHYNHSLFWRVMSPNGGGTPAPDSALHLQLAKSFGGFEEFKQEFTDKALKHFGSGWAWLVRSNAEGLIITATPNQDNPIVTGDGTPILGLDVWEHAYYLKYQNKRPDYIEAWWGVVNWEMVAENYSSK